MRTETFETAKEINSRINAIEREIESVESDRDTCTGKTINTSLYCPEDNEDVKKVVINHLKNKLKRLKKEFSNLK